MAQARQANQMGGLGVQSQGAQQMTPLLQQAQMNVADPTMMQAQPARLMEMDKYRYVNAAQDRAQRDKELLFKTLDAKEQRAHALQAQQNAYDMSLRLEQEKMRMKAEQDDAITSLADKRYGPLREKTARVFKDYNQWISGGAQTELQNRFKEKSKMYALQHIPFDEIKKRYFGEGGTYQGVEPPQFGSDVHKALALQMLNETEAGKKAILSIYGETQREISQETTNKTAGYRAAMDGLKALKFSVPYIEDQQGGGKKEGGPITIENKGVGSELDLPGLGGGPRGGAVDPTTGDDGTFAGKQFNPLVADIPVNIAEGIANTAETISNNPGGTIVAPITGLTATEFLSQDRKGAQYQEGLEKELDAKQGETDKLKKDGTPKKLSPKAMEQVRKKIAPEVMLEHAKKLDPRGLGKKDLDYFKNIDEKDFGKLVEKSRGGWIKRLSKYGLDKVMVPDPDTGERKVMSIKDIMKSRIGKAGGVLAIGGLIIDAINYSQAPSAEEKKELLEMTQSHMQLEMVDGEIKVINSQMSDDQRARLNQLLSPSPLVPQ